MRSSSPTLSYIKPTSFENIKTALSDYRNERFDAIKDQYPQSQMSAKLIYGHANTLGTNSQILRVQLAP
ncbi:hypothetical protein K457DRAFT_19204 [Linnemannia elongata AG-77]|uniref:Uncharacterized protein n=1 Tax=Linnemannia elongata AG-77 TaxID=1314771 RepID=A0A197JVS0_9FUNG|nr:hypothetical protein K457DRAFT_19204 [Linnemannia elongata AG-77]